jgi:hypothetical protein
MEMSAEDFSQPLFTFSRTPGFILFFALEE